MSQASQEIARQFANASVNKKNWGAVAYNVLSEGLSGDGVTDDTAKLQALINKAISEGRKTILFPHGEYYVTSLTNADKVEFVGDNSKFVGGYNGAIGDLGGFAALQADFEQHKSEVVSRTLAVTRDVSLAGVQTISLPFLAKSITIIATIPTTKIQSNGFWSPTSQCFIAAEGAGSTALANNSSIVGLYKDGSNVTYATLQNVTSTGFELKWEKIGSQTGTASLFVLATTH